MKKLFVYIALVMLFYSCEEKSDWEVPSEDFVRLVVEGSITNERTSHTVKLSLPTRELNEQPVPLSNAYVAVTDQEKVFEFTEDPEQPGTYRSAPDAQGVTGKIYVLYIRVGQFEFAARSFMVPVEPLRELRLRPCGDRENYYHWVPRNEGDPFMIQATIDWSSTPACNTGDCSAQINHYHLNSIDVNEFFKPEKETVCFPAGAMIVMKKYSMNPDHQEFIRSLLMETEWRGGVFDVRPGNVKTNLSPGAIGYFFASTVVTDSVIVE